MIGKVAGDVGAGGFGAASAAEEGDAELRARLREVGRGDDREGGGNIIISLNMNSLAF